MILNLLFQHTAARRRLAPDRRPFAWINSFNTQPPEGGWMRKLAVIAYQLYSFNTQPPEGGWRSCNSSRTQSSGFNTQPPEGGWATSSVRIVFENTFQHTAARRRLEESGGLLCDVFPFQHTAARRRLVDGLDKRKFNAHVSTHSRPKAAGS